MLLIIRKEIFKYQFIRTQFIKNIYAQSKRYNVVVIVENSIPTFYWVETVFVFDNRFNIQNITVSFLIIILISSKSNIKLSGDYYIRSHECIRSLHYLLLFVLFIPIYPMLKIKLLYLNVELSLLLSRWPDHSREILDWKSISEGYPDFM